MKRHWQQWLPNRYSQLENPDQYFTSVGEQIEEQILQISSSMEAQQQSDLNSIGYLGCVGRLNAIQKSAQEIALSEVPARTREPGRDGG